MKKTCISETPAKKKKAQRLNVRERKFIKGVIAGLTPTEAMRQAGYAESTALKKQTAKWDIVGKTVQELMDNLGLTDGRLLEVLEAGLGAMKSIRCETTKDFVLVEDHLTRHRFLELAFRLKGYLTKQDINLGNAGNSPLKITVRFVAAPKRSEPGVNVIDYETGSVGG